MSDIKLRPWQAKAIKKCLNWFTKEKKDHRFLINAAPGSGKTICASVIAEKLIAMGEIDRVIVIAPLNEVVRQWSEEFKFVTKRHMSKVTGSDTDINDFGVDLCATWNSVQGLLDGFQHVCNNSKTLIICDEHHHAAISAAWGNGADGAFNNAKYVLVLTGTPIRSDGEEMVWFAFTEKGKIDHPEEGTYTLTYGEAVDLGYCRPITFHRHWGQYSVEVEKGQTVIVDANEDVAIPKELKRVPGIQQALEFYQLACKPKLRNDGTLDTDDLTTYQASMLEKGIEKLDEVKKTKPNAGGLVIAPSITVAKYMSGLLENLTGERPDIVHSELKNSETTIDRFRNSKKNWIVSVAMVSEGVDIKRLRVLVFLPKAKTELFFRQAMGRVVRTSEDDDMSFANVIMPTDKTFDLYARRVEKEMPESYANPKEAKYKKCPSCHTENELGAKNCIECGEVFPERKINYKPCPECGALNPLHNKECQSCGASFENRFSISLEEACRDGGIISGMDISEDEMQEGERISPDLVKAVLASNDQVLIDIVRRLPPESHGRLGKIYKQVNNDDK